MQQKFGIQSRKIGLIHLVALAQIQTHYLFIVGAFVRVLAHAEWNLSTTNLWNCNIAWKKIQATCGSGISVFAIQLKLYPSVEINMKEMIKQDNVCFCVQDGRDGAVAAAESRRPGADCRGHGGHHEGLQGETQTSDFFCCHKWNWNFCKKEMNVIATGEKAAEALWFCLSVVFLNLQICPQRFFMNLCSLFLQTSTQKNKARQNQGEALTADPVT